MQPTQIALGGTAGATNLLKLDYSYGEWVSGSIDATKNNGNIVQQVITVPNTGLVENEFTATQKYYYDSLDRLDDSAETINSAQTWQQDFTYDRYGNRSFVDANTTTIPRNCGSAPNFTICTLDQKKYNPTINAANDNRINTSQDYSYDAAGNTLTDAQGRSFTYDGENKQVLVKTGSITNGKYWYDGDGKRVKKEGYDSGGNLTELTIFVYDVAGKLIAEYSPEIAAVEDAKVAYLTNDHLGSPRINTDRDGNVTARHDYHPFGEEIITTARASHDQYIPDSVRKQFTGYERDGESGLDFAQARNYNPANGRFTTVDPITMTVERLTDPQQINLYAYCRNNPYTFVDPTGKILSYADREARKKFDEYVQFLNKDKKKYKSELATIDRLKNSEVDYQLAVGGKNFEGSEGNTTTDGNKVFVSISNVGGANGETFSLNSRFAHELEHARQFDSGEFAFYKDQDGGWHPSHGTYDIGDEVKAWKVQLNTAGSGDFWSRKNGKAVSSLLRFFADAKTDDERAGVLAREAYPNRNPSLYRNFDVMGEGFKPGQLIRSTTVFGRINSVLRRP